MFSLEKLVSIGFSIAQATVLNKLFKRVGYAAPFKKTDLVAEAVLPDNKIIEINGIDGLKEIFKSSTQFYTDIETIFVQRGNNDPWQGRVETVVVYQVTEQVAESSDGGEVVYDWASAVDNFVKVNANWAQLVISSREPASILAAAKKANTSSTARPTNIHCPTENSEEYSFKIFKYALKLNIFPIPLTIPINMLIIPEKNCSIKSYRNLI